jgi:predicted DNA-binding protein (MmcQ/YjbR family)
MNVEQVRDFILSLNDVTEDQPFGEDNITFRLQGKIFVCLWIGGAQENRPFMSGEHDSRNNAPRLALKLSPDRNEALREQFTAVTPAWHWNKKHWSDVLYEQIDDALLKAWIGESYQLVVSKLPKAIRQRYESANVGNHACD